MRLLSMGMAVIVMVVMLNATAAIANGLRKKAQANNEYECPRDERQPRIELFRKEQVRRQHGRQAQHQYPGGVGDGHAQRKHERVADRAAPTDDVGGHDALSMASR